MRCSFPFPNAIPSLFNTGLRKWAAERNKIKCRIQDLTKRGCQCLLVNLRVVLNHLSKNSAGRQFNIWIDNAPHNMIVVTQGSFGHEECNMCISFPSSVHGSTADKWRIFTKLCDTKSTVHQSWETVVSFMGSLYLLQHCRTAWHIPSCMTWILEDVCWALSSKVYEPIGFRGCTITGPSSTMLWAFGSRIHFSRQGSMSDFVSDLISPRGCVIFLWRTNLYRS